MFSKKRYLLTVTAILIITSLLSLVTPGLADNNEQKVDWKALKASSNRVLEKKPLDILANFQLTVALANLGEVETAYELFKSIDEKITLTEFNRTITPFLESMAGDDDDLLWLNYTAFSSAINNDYKQAVLNFKKILRIDPQNVWIHNYLAAYQIELEEYKQAKKNLDRALKIQDNDYSHLLLAMLNYRQGRILQALFELGRSGSLMNKFLFD